jgi:hypothetical protein
VMITNLLEDSFQVASGVGKVCRGWLRMGKRASFVQKPNIS